MAEQTYPRAVGPAVHTAIGNSNGGQAEQADSRRSELIEAARARWIAALHERHEPWGLTPFEVQLPQGHQGGRRAPSDVRGSGEVRSDGGCDYSWAGAAKHRMTRLTSS